MKLLLDQGVPYSAAGLLRQIGIDTVHVSEVRLSTATDDAIIAWSVIEDRVIVTFDSDFHMLLAKKAACRPSVIRIRVERLQAREVLALIQEVLSVGADYLANGAVVSVQNDRIRIRKLPLR